MTDAAAVAATYFDAWKARDLGRLRSVLADDVDFAEPLARLRRVFHDEPDVLTWFDLSTSVADPVPVANWMHAEDAKITRIRVAFDARGIAGGS
jgi:hypothetical protein